MVAHRALGKTRKGFPVKNFSPIIAWIANASLSQVLFWNTMMLVIFAFALLASGLAIVEYFPWLSKTKKVAFLALFFFLPPATMFFLRSSFRQKFFVCENCSKKIFYTEITDEAEGKYNSYKCSGGGMFVVYDVPQAGNA